MLLPALYPHPESRGSARHIPRHFGNCARKWLGILGCVKITSLHAEKSPQFIHGFVRIAAKQKSHLRPAKFSLRNSPVPAPPKDCAPIKITSDSIAIFSSARPNVFQFPVDRRSRDFSWPRSLRHLRSCNRV